VTWRESFRYLYTVQYDHCNIADANNIGEKLPPITEPAAKLFTADVYSAFLFNE